MTQQNQQLARTEPNGGALEKFKSVATLLQSEQVQSSIARALPRHITPERMIRVAMTAIQKTPKLAECDQRSLISAIIQAAELGLEPNTPLGHAYLIPYWNKNTKRNEAQLMPGYRGMIALARRSGKVQGVYAELVYSKDFFEVTFGLDKTIVHKPALDEEDRGDLVGAYAVAKFADGYTDFEYMSAAEINKIRRRSKSPEAGPWVTDTGEMWRKTPIRRLFKRLPASIEDTTIQKAVEIDEYHDAGFDNVAPLELGDGGAAPEAISEEQRVALVAAAKESGQDLGSIVQSAGFEMLAHITVDRYDDILAAVSEPLHQAPAPEPDAAAAAPVEKLPEEPAAAPAKSIEEEMSELIDDINELMKIKPTAQEILGGRKVDQMDLKQLKAFQKELAKA